MTDVNKSKTQIINSVDDALDLYAPPPAGFTGMVGLEVEMALYKPGYPKPDIPTAETMIRMQADLKKKGHDAQLEAAGVLEYASPPVALQDVTSLVRRVESDIAEFTDAAKAYGYDRAPYSILPTTTLQDAMDNMVARERLVTSIGAMQGIFDPVTLNIPLLTTGVQTSFSPKDSDEMFRMMYRAYAMTPLLIASMNASSGFIRNEETRDDTHFRAKYYEAYGSSGAIADSFLNASNGEELVRNHIEAVFNTRMHFAYDTDGKIIPSTPDRVITFASLAAEGLNTLSNYELAETFIYNDVKICNLRDAEGNVVGKRLEVRAADSGMTQGASSLLMTAALVPEGRAAQAFEAVLKDYGFTLDPRQDAELLRASRKAAVEHGGNFMDIPFGKGSMRDFAMDVAAILVDCYDGRGVGPELAKLTEVLMTGECDAKRFKAQAPELKDVVSSLNAAATAETLPANPRLSGMRPGSAR